MISEGTFTVEPWCVREPALDLSVLAQSESVFALSNGHIGLRGNLDEGEPYGIPGSYLNSFYELRPLPYAEAGYGFPDQGQTVVNVTNGKLVRLLVDDEPFDVRYGTLRSHERVLDLRAGVLRRTVEWVSPSGKAVRIRSTRLVSFTQRAVAAVCWEVEPVDSAVRLIVQSELVANEAVPALSGDPRVSAALKEPLVPEEMLTRPSGGLLVHRTRLSALRMAAGMYHEVDGPPGTDVATDGEPDWVRTTVTCALQPGEQLRLVKLLSYGWSSQRSLPALRDQVAAALSGARVTGWDELLAEQRAYLDEFWDAADVEVEGDAEVQQAVRFGLFHVLQAGARTEQRAIPAKGLTGPGYDGHTFWDTESFVLPVLTYTLPHAAADALRWRQSILPMARDRAAVLRLRGATFPWRTIRGQECSSYWPAGTAAFHINADVADACIRYVLATEDVEFERATGMEILVETARLWRSLGHHDGHGRFHLDGVTGPDEYSAVVDDNVYTNLMAQRNLRAAADAVARHPARAGELAVDAEEAAGWRDAAERMCVPYDEGSNVHTQDAQWTVHREWDWSTTGHEDYPLLLNTPYFDLYRKQVAKQADLVLAMHWRGDAFTPDQKRRNFAYYEARTVRDSSLSACTQSVLAAEVGHLELAHDYLGEAALMDLRDLEHNTRDGVHVASLAGAWLALVAGLGGMRDHDGELSFAPRLPEAIERLAFSIRWRGARLRVEVHPHEVTYSLRDGGRRLRLTSHGEEVVVSSDEPVTRPVPPAVDPGPRPRQPPGRAPMRRGHTT